MQQAVSQKAFHHLNDKQQPKINIAICNNKHNESAEATLNGISWMFNLSLGDRG